MTTQPEIIPLPSEGHRGLDRYSVALISAATFDGLLDGFNRVADEHREGRCFLTLDDLNQCRYTSGHAASKHGFDDEVDYPDDDTPEAVADYEAALFAASLKELRDPERAVGWEELPGTLATVPEDIDALVRLNREPSLLLDDLHVVQCLPTAADEDLLANLPNGYFAADWDPFQCRAVVERLCGRHGYALLGLGASLLGFVTQPRSLSLSKGRATDPLISDLQALYGQPESPAWAELAEVVRHSPVLLLGYTEDFADLAAHADPPGPAGDGS